MEYLTQSDYQALGGTSSAFPVLIVRVNNIIDEATHGRITGDVPVQAKMLAFELVNWFDRNGEKMGVTSESESAGNVSQSASYGKARSAEVDDIIYDYLGGMKNADGVPLLYRGASA